MEEGGQSILLFPLSEPKVSLNVVQSHFIGGSSIHTEDVVLYICRDRLDIRPIAWPLFGLRAADGLWLAPNQNIHELDRMKHFPLEFRLRFKVPVPLRLAELDPNAMKYYYEQIRHEYITGRTISSKLEEVEMYRKNGVWHKIRSLPQPSNEKDEHLMKDLWIKALEISGILVGIEVKEERTQLSKALKQIDKFLPSTLWYGAFQRLLHSSKIREGLIRRCQDLERENKPVIELKIHFLTLVERFMPHYFEESFTGETTQPGTQTTFGISVIIRPPGKDVEPNLEMEPLPFRPRDKRKELCLIDQLSQISVEERDDGVIGIQLARKNGIPFYMNMNSKMEALAFLSHVCGYYRLCEKWTISLTTFIVFPSLDQYLSEKIHGPITREFVNEKMNASNRKKPGWYLMSQGTEKYNLFYLHVWVEGKAKPEVFAIGKSANGFEVIGLGKGTFKTMRELRSMLHEHQNVQFENCIHPSEYDKASTLLLCRSTIKLRGDVLGTDLDAKENGEKVVIQFNQLSRFEALVQEGVYTAVWPGFWQKHRDKKEVAIKQLKREFRRSHLEDFLYLSQTVLSWDHPSLIQYFGTTLTSKANPMALVCEYFKLGHLAGYLECHGTEIEDLDLMEAARSVTNGVWYLQEKNLVHGKIRCENVFVFQHDDTRFHVKLGDPGLDNEYTTGEYHWLALEQLLAPDPCSKRHITLKTDIWALGTTFWQIFSMGSEPLPELGNEEVRQKYIQGFRLERPSRISPSLNMIYQIITDCWNPIPDERRSPQVIVRDLSQLLYRLFNSRNVNTYMMIDDFDSPVSSSSPIHSNDSSSCRSTLMASAETEVTNMGAAKSLELQNGTTKFVPMFQFMMSNHAVRNQINQEPNPNPFFKDIVQSWVESQNGNGTGSSDCSPYHVGTSQFTSQTSLSSFTTTDSVSSIYTIDNDTQLTFNEERPLGVGNFGVVYKGILTKNNGEEENVAIKKLKDDLAAGDMQQELKIMRMLKHKNIVSIKATYNTSNILIVMELLSNGSLNDYLRSHKDMIQYPKQLFEWAQNIVEGMVYLSQMKIIHRDLAARNILVDNDCQVKISDFGLARTLNSDVYSMSSDTDLPVPWIAPEGLHQRTFSVKSDVWSFGVTLWEIFSYGEEPFLDGCENFFRTAMPTEDLQMFKQRQQDEVKEWIRLLDHGARLGQPDKCPVALYTKVMSECWHLKPEIRPKFETLAKIINQIALQMT
ncbi:hypothetical protein TCAL_08883, partial [Tigriopus californicus]|eukprot:TCALIF_08883-PA protein Name:"Similar to hop Tyrosine-protein kinase hopscotch (Drosophila melanogaster)" AED:0.01 eAED:0.01 QI:17/-1/0/1/-1/0/1/0/1216